jgi:formate hydrogenlyase transcriptional activator
LRSTASSPKVGAWLVENGPRKLEQLFRAIVYHPSAPILITDNDRYYRDASFGAAKLLGLHATRSSDATWTIS